MAENGIKRPRGRPTLQPFEILPRWTALGFDEAVSDSGLRTRFVLGPEHRDRFLKASKAARKLQRQNISSQDSGC